mmetsp:Transcript_48938/g.111049  ORF Transcript_48938/g.111049 Transcript_48938/m.111049 type:complete len:200 (-) Transcript_48938:189-788(-)
MLGRGKGGRRPGSAPKKSRHSEREANRTSRFVTPNAAATDLTHTTGPWVPTSFACPCLSAPLSDRSDRLASCGEEGSVARYGALLRASLLVGSSARFESSMLGSLPILAEAKQAVAARTGSPATMMATTRKFSEENEARPSQLHPSMPPPLPRASVDEKAHSGPHKISTLALFVSAQATRSADENIPSPLVRWLPSRVS